MSFGSRRVLEAKRSDTNDHLCDYGQTIYLMPMEMLDGFLVLDRAAGDLEGQVYRAVRAEILAGRLSPGTRLPATRALAGTIGVARSTLVQAFDRLRAEGYVEAAQGSGTRVAALPALVGLEDVSLRPPPALPVPSAAYGAFESGVPDLAAFPHAIWARCLGVRARSLRVHDLGYGAPEGLPALREAILTHVAAARGVVATPDQVVILPSTGAAIDLLAQVTLRPGDTAWIEEPGYPTAQQVLRRVGARLVPVPCDAEGLDPAAAIGPAPRLIYVTPSHQYPTGVTMSLPRRLALLDAAASAGAIILEDDYDSEFQYGGRPIACLQGIDRRGSVAYLGTFSKTLAPGLRVAYAILPHRLLAEALVLQKLRGATVSIHVQAALADFLRDGHFRAHVRRMSAVYGARMETALTAMRQQCEATLIVPAQRGGLQFAARFKDAAADDVAIAGALQAAWVAAKPLSTFYLGTPQPGLLLGIALATDADAAARRMRRVCARTAEYAALSRPPTTAASSPNLN
jgi:GntR family transcriptional regulator/MocR family aminotransferase